jgi:hypothetical protein
MGRSILSLGIGCIMLYHGWNCVALITQLGGDAGCRRGLVRTV